MKPSDLANLGFSLAGGAKDEATQRTAINRLYYGAHHEACCRLFRVRLAESPLGQHRRHTDLVERLRDPLEPKSGRVGDLLADLSRMRTEADYQLSPPLKFQRRSLTTSELLSKAVETTQQLWKAMEEYSPGEAKDGCICLVAYQTR